MMPRKAIIGSAVALLFMAGRAAAQFGGGGLSTIVNADLQAFKAQVNITTAAIGVSTGNAAYLANTQTFTGFNTFSSSLTITSSVTAVAFYGDGSNLTGLSVSTPAVHITAENGPLGVGATFYSFVPANNIVLEGMALTLTDPGEMGTSSLWYCGSGPGSLSVVSYSTDTAGHYYSSAGSVPIAAGNKVVCMMGSTDQDITPSGIVEMVYKEQ